MLNILESKTKFSTKFYITQSRQKIFPEFCFIDFWTTDFRTVIIIAWILHSALLVREIEVGSTRQENQTRVKKWSKKSVFEDEQVRPSWVWRSGIETKGSSRSQSIMSIRCRQITKTNFPSSEKINHFPLRQNYHAIYIYAQTNSTISVSANKTKNSLTINHVCDFDVKVNLGR